MNINKHAIILPALITSAVSLHILSYYIEEPEEIVYNNPIETTSPSSLPSSIQAINNQTNSLQTIQETSKPINKISPKPTPESVKTPEAIKTPDVVKTPDIVKTPNVVKTPEPIKTPEIIESSNVEIPQVPKEEIIKSKDFKEIIREARINSGRIDPFLSLKPPKAEVIPQIPQELMEEKKTLLSLKIEKEKEELNKNKISYIKQQKFDNSKSNKAKPLTKDNKVKPPIQIPKTDTGKKIVVDDNNQQEEILVEEAKRLSEGIKLTGIITGSKPLAILSVNDESKVLGVGDKLIDNNDNLRIVSIDFNRKSILITDGYYKARILIQEEEN